MELYVKSLSQKIAMNKILEFSPLYQRMEYPI